MTSDIRTVIRQILLEELDNYIDRPGSEVRKEKVPMGNDRDLKAFALRVLDMSVNRDLKADLQSGKIQFVLQTEVMESNTDVSNSAGSQKLTRPDSIKFQKGLVTEKDIAKLDSNIARIDAGKNVFFTPLAKDEIRRRGLRIERIPQ